MPNSGKVMLGGARNTDSNQEKSLCIWRIPRRVCSWRGHPEGTQRTGDGRPRIAGIWYSFRKVGVGEGHLISQEVGPHWHHAHSQHLVDTGCAKGGTVNHTLGKDFNI